MTNLPLPAAEDSVPIPGDQSGAEPPPEELREPSQSGPVAASAMARFTGTLDDLPVADLLQILQLAGKSADITLSHEGAESRLWCSDGAIIDAESGRLRGEPAVYRILAVERGWLSAVLRSASRPRSIFGATQRLLLEAARRKDESVALRDKLGDAQRCFRLAEGLDVERLGLSPVELWLLRSFASPRSLHEALAATELGDFETLTLLVAWLDAGHLVDAGLRRAPVATAAARAPEPSHSIAPQAAALSLVPLVASVRPGGEKARSTVATARFHDAWRWGALAAIVLLPCGYFAGATAARVLEPSATRSALRAGSAAAQVAALPSSYAVALRVDPLDAEIWLDGSKVAVGHWQTTLPRNGSTHELRVTAAGHLPASILFVDAAPRAELRLELVPLLETSRDASAPTPNADLIDAQQEPPKPRKRPALARAAVRRETARTIPRARPRVVGTALSVANAPQVQATEHIDPIIRRLD